MGTYLVQAFDASTIGRSAVLLLLAFTGAFAQLPPTGENTIVTSRPPAAVALARFMANQPPDGGTPVETIEIEASLPKLNKSGRLYAIRRIVSARHPNIRCLKSPALRW